MAADDRADPSEEPECGADALEDRERALVRREAELRKREFLAGRRDRVADQRDQIADERERVADEREQRADEREGTSEEQERARLRRADEGCSAHRRARSGTRPTLTARLRKANGAPTRLMGDATGVSP